MFRIRSAVALLALGLLASAGHAQTTPAVSTVVAFSLSNPVGNLVRGPDGALYGVANPATAVTGGVIFRAAVDGTAVSTLYQLKPTDAISPGAGLLLASDGLLYGTTKFGTNTDVSGAGSVFRIAPDGTGFAIVFRFATNTGSNQDLNPINTTGAYPEGELIEGNDGYLYGVARAGGANGTGTIYKVSRDGTDFRLLHTFAVDTATTPAGSTVTVDGASPTGQLVEGADGYFYGTATSGGTFGRGSVYRIAFDGTGFQVLHHFSEMTTDTTTLLGENADGAVPFAGLVEGNDGFFYGVTSQGGLNGYGVVFAISPDGATFTVLHAFSNADGARPLAELTLGSDTKLYGTTASGGVDTAGATTALGTLFSIDRAGTNFTRMYSFQAKDGTSPGSSVLQTAPGVLIGLTGGSGNCGYGTIWRYSAAGDTVTGNTRCGQKKNNNNNGGGSAGWVVLLLLAGLALGRGLGRRRAG